jgi:hypothetical protein
MGRTLVAIALLGFNAAAVAAQPRLLPRLLVTSKKTASSAPLPRNPT